MEVAALVGRVNVIADDAVQDSAEDRTGEVGQTFERPDQLRVHVERMTVPEVPVVADVRLRNGVIVAVFRVLLDRARS
jgi:hypothetical protein